MKDIRVALIEDHDLTRMGLKAALRQETDMEFIGEAANGVGGLHLLKTRQPDVAIVDIGLPGIDGIDVTRQFREFQAEHSDCETKVLMLTMHDDEKSIIAAFASGANSYCMKQTELDDLMVAIRETHEGNSWIDPAIASIVLRQMRTPTALANKAHEKISIDALDPELAQILDTYPLTERELQILELIVAGGTNADIADTLFVTVGTVKTHVRNILNKLGAHDRTQAAVRALRAGLVH